MVGNWPHSILTLPRTAVTKVLILPLMQKFLKLHERCTCIYSNPDGLFPPSYMSAMFYPIWSISQQMWAISPLSGAEEGELSNVGSAEGLASEEEEATEMMVVKWLMKGGWLGWQEGRYMRFHHWRPVRKTPILIRSHLSFFERCEKNNVGFPTTILIKASLENNVEMLRV